MSTRPRKVFALEIPYGGKAAILPIDAIFEVQRDVEALRGQYPSDILETVVQYFYNFDLSGLPFAARSVVVIALPMDIVRVRLHHEGRVYDCFNDGFHEDSLTQQAAEDGIRRQFERNGYLTHRYDELPLKQLAVRSGLAEYGRNNIVYVDGIGSFSQILAMLTDMPTDAQPLPLRRMASCERCVKCVENCPTGAIGVERGLIDAERCLTYFNEFIDLMPFPEWIPRTAHHSLHGCMICQLNCPQNRAYLSRETEPVVFFEEEVAILLKGGAMEELPDALLDKVKMLELADYLPLLPRNIAAIMKMDWRGNLE